MRNAAKLVERAPKVCLRWLEEAPPEIKADIEYRKGITLLGKKAVTWLIKTSQNRPRIQR